MKKFLVFMMVALLVAGLVGTAGAQTPTKRTLQAPASIFASPVTQTGVSVYVLSGATTTVAASGVSLVAINPTTGTSVALLNVAAGSTVFSTPAVTSGETVFVQLVNPTNTGTSIYAVNGNGSAASGNSYYVASFSSVGVGVPGGFFPLSGASLPSFTPPLTLDPSGASVYATTQRGTNASVIALNRASGTIASFATGVSAIWAAPMVSGNSFYVMGDYELNAASGVSLIAFNKATPFTVAARTTVVTGAATPFATPTISGNSLFVVDATGGLTAFNKNTLVRGTNDYIQFGAAANSQVTASPVANGSFLVVTQNAGANAGVTVFNLSRPLSANTPWFFVWPNAGTQIISTPAISNGILYTAVNEPTGGRIDRFNLGGHTAGGKITAPDFAAITTDSAGAALGTFSYSSPIIKGENLIIVSNTGVAGSAPVLYTVDLNAGGTNAWPQFKFDAARTGNNTAAAVAPVVDDDDSGCFISTLK